MSAGAKLIPRGKDDLTIGEFRIFVRTSGRVWITNGAGEGMETTIKKLQKTLRRFWRKEF